MNLTETLWWYLENIGDYFLQMLPCMCAALILFLLLRPWRQRRLTRMGLSSGPWREGGLLLFAMFAAGLAALTLFPAYFWTAWHWRAVLDGTEPLFRPVDFEIQLQTLQMEPLCSGEIHAGGNRCWSASVPPSPSSLFSFSSAAALISTT